MNTKDILLHHYRRYPLMQIKDVVKLLFQNEFGGGHMIRNEAESYQRLQAEVESLSYDRAQESEADLFEDIGNGLFRLHLKGLQHRHIKLDTINRFFIQTANTMKGSIEGFEEKLDILKACCRSQELPYSMEEVEDYLSNYKQQGYSPVSHSEVYRNAYQPAYRIVGSEYIKYIDLLSGIDQLMSIKDTVCIAIDGNSGAGKSTLASLIYDLYDCNIFHMDDYFLRPELRTEDRLKEIGGNVDYIRFRTEIIEGLKSGRDFSYRSYDCKQMALQEPIVITPKRLNIIEGAYSMHPTLIDTYDYKIFLHIDEDEQKQRIRSRNGEIMLKRFVEEWIPKENSYFEKFNIKNLSDLVYS